MTLRMRLLTSICLALLGCGDDEVAPIEDAGRDASTAFNDAGPDAEAVDAGEDAGSVDADVPDGSIEADGAAPEVDGAISPADNCPDHASTDQTDTDDDGLGDACDEDDDGDGFADLDDPAPLDPTNPGDFSTPEAILAHPLVEAALAAVEEAGITFPVHLGLEPPDISGYYVKDDLTGRTLASDNGQNVGGTIVGAEARLVVDAGNLLSSAGIFFTGGQSVAVFDTSGTILRGEGNSYSAYSRGRTKCTTNGSDYDMFGIGISSATVDPSTGDLTDSLELGVTVDAEGSLTSVCAQMYQGTREIAGGWVVVDNDRYRHVEPSVLQFMCVDGDDAYAPGESWRRADAACSCGENATTACE